MPSPNPGMVFVDCIEVVGEIEATEDQPARSELCGNIAEVSERYYTMSTSGRVYIFRTRCIKGHIIDQIVPRDEWIKTI